MQQNRVTTHGAQGKGTTGGKPSGNRGGPHAQAPRTPSPSNSRPAAFPTTGGMRRD